VPAGEGDYTVRVPKRYVFVAVLLALTLAVGEAAERVAEWRHRMRRAGEQGFHFETTSGVRFADAHGPLAMTLDPLLGYSLRGGQSAVGVTINSRGFRDRERAQRKPDGVVRVVVLGGSTVFGFGMPDDESLFTRVLERRLAGALGPDRPLEVINAGVPGYTSTQEEILLANKVMDYAPDLVVLFDGWNDFWTAGNSREDRPIVNLAFPQMEDAILRGEHPGWNLLLDSAIVRSLARLAQGWNGSAARPKADQAFGIFHDHPEALPLYRRELVLACRTARASGVGVLLVPQPELFQRSGTIPPAETALRGRQQPGYADYARTRYPDYVTVARDIAAAEKAGFLDGTRIFDTEGEQVFLDFVHLNARGHALVAAALQPAVLEALKVDLAAARGPGRLIN
jgi:lysophospholipase L1-like esterase